MRQGTNCRYRGGVPTDRWDSQAGEEEKRCVVADFLRSNELSEGLSYTDTWLEGGPAHEPAPGLARHPVLDMSGAGR